MSFVIAAPEYIAVTATDLANIGSTISMANAAAWAPTSRLLPAGAEAVSAEIATLFGAHRRGWQWRRRRQRSADQRDGRRRRHRRQVARRARSGRYRIAINPMWRSGPCYGIEPFGTFGGASVAG